MPSLSYEVPTYVEHRRQPQGVIVASLGAMACEALIGVFCVWLQAGFSWTWVSSLPTWPFALGFVLVAFLLAGNAAIRGRIAVYGDHLVASQTLMGLTIWRRRVLWSSIRRCEVRRRPKGEKSQFEGLEHLGAKTFMFDGNGIRLHLFGFSELLIGSAEPDRLLAAIDAARFPTEPSAEPLGSVGNP